MLAYLISILAIVSILSNSAIGTAVGIETIDQHL